MRPETNHGACRSPLTSHQDQPERDAVVRDLQHALSEHVKSLGLSEAAIASNGNGAKSAIRRSHSAQRAAFLAKEKSAIERHVSRLSARFADGHEVSPDKIEPVIVPVRSNEESGLLFRLATTLWSVPVSRGYGRRMRFLVIDANNEKLIGILALGDPVFNLQARDEWIGWNQQQRRRRLTSVMDAFVAGAVPPYSMILGGKLVVSLIGSAEISAHFANKYTDSRGIISGERKKPKLALVTVTSALGRSSLYNRLRLPGLVQLERLGTTTGWGHFHVPDTIFREMRRLLAIDGHRYADGHGYGQGPNWKIRVIREAIKKIGMDDNFLLHGIQREIFAMPLAPNFREYLRCTSDSLDPTRPTAREISEACAERWIIRRAETRPEFAEWTRDQTVELIQSSIDSAVSTHESTGSVAVEPT